MVDVYIVGTRTDEHVRRRSQLHDRFIGYLDIYGADRSTAKTKIQPPAWWRGGTTAAQAEVMARMLRGRQK